MTAIVFSKDRALQLDAFLRSYALCVTTVGTVYVLYRATTQRHADAYAALFRAHPHACAVRQTQNFKADVLSLLPTTGHAVFFVDDQVFVRPWVGDAVSGLSLRLGRNLTTCYPMNAAQPLPSFRTIGETMLAWRWADGALDWGYPLSLDGHVFGAEEIRTLVQQVAFQSPNTLEAALQTFAPQFLLRQGVCYLESLVVSIPWNRVQEDCPNRCAAANAASSAEELLEHWEAGDRIDLSGLLGVVNESAHQEFPLMLEPRA